MQRRAIVVKGEITNRTIEFVSYLIVRNFLSQDSFLFRFHRFEFFLIFYYTAKEIQEIEISNRDTRFKYRKEYFIYDFLRV